MAYQLRMWPKKGNFPRRFTADTMEAVEDELVNHFHFKKVEVRDGAGVVIIARDKDRHWTGLGAEAANAAV